MSHHFFRCSLKAKFPKRRQAAAVLCLRHLQDKSSIVRKYAIRTLTVMISTHPFSLYGGELNLTEWTTRLDKLKYEIEVKKSSSSYHLFLSEKIERYNGRQRTSIYELR